VSGSPEERELATLAIRITLQQRNGGKVDVDFGDLEDRDDVSTLDVPQKTVGFLLGSKGGTLRKMESEHRVFMFFDNDNVRSGKHGPSKRLYVIGTRMARDKALDEAEDVVRYKLTGESRGRPNDQGPRDSYSQRERAPLPQRPRYDDRDRYDDRPRYDERPRYDNRDRHDDRPRYDERPRYEERRYDERPRYDDRDRYENRPRYDDQPRYDERPRYDNRDRGHRSRSPRGRY